MLEFDVEGFGFDEMTAGFDRLIAGVKDLRPAWPDVQRVYHGIETRAFDTQGSSQPTGEWKKLSEGYRRWKEKKYPGNKILVLKGALRLSLTGKNAGLAVTTMSAMEYSEFTTVPYAKFHQGGIGQKKRMPVSLSRRDVDDLVVPVRRYVGRVIKESFRGSGKVTV